MLQVYSPSLYEVDVQAVVADGAPLARSGTSRAAATLTSSEYRSARKQLKSNLADGARPSPPQMHHEAETAAYLVHRWSEMHTDEAATPTPCSDLEGLQTAFQAVTHQVAQLEDDLQTARQDDSTTEVKVLLDSLVADVRTLGTLPKLHHLRTSLEGVGLQPLLAALEPLDVNPNGATDALEAAWLTSLLEHIQLTDTRIGTFSGEAHTRAVEGFQSADREHIETTAARVRRLCAEHAVAVQDEREADAALIKGEAAKKRKHLPVRQLFSAAPDVMTSLKPCWVMSPLIVSQVLPSDQPHFDVVVFDEASQVRPAEAIPAILRGRQLVVAGDERQLPPTDFFSGSNVEMDEEEDLEAALKADSSFESILEAMDPFVKFRLLEWHYRSRDERLIAFSNAHLYDRSLTTFPGVAGPDCIRHVHVPFDPNRVSSTVSSDPEVERVVALILEHAENNPRRSLGVIAMGSKHAERIEEALRAALKERNDLEDFFDETREEPFFVKNLERVQGDERDAIILSVGYGKNEHGRLLYRFGPLNTAGGERRLNVAVTRAKEQMTLVSSFSHLDMDPDRSSARGVELLRAYLEYCASNGSKLDAAAAEKPQLNPFEIDVRDHLEKAGLSLSPQFGASGYRIDYAVKHPDMPGRMVLAIECDGASYHSSPTARDRDRLRQEQLERLGWHFHRIWSQDWFTNKQIEIERACEAYEESLAHAAQLDSRDEAELGDAVVEEEQVDGVGVEGVGGPSSTGLAAMAERTGPMPIPRANGRNISDYSISELIALVEWIESDGLLRTRIDLRDEAIRELGYQRRGPRIVEAIDQAIDRTRGT